jgi:hypothetical protein
MSILPIGASFATNSNYNGHSNYADFAITESRTNLEMVMPDFEKAIAAGYNPNDVKDMIFKSHQIDESDFTDVDKKELVRRVDNIWKAELRKRGRYV